MPRPVAVRVLPGCRGRIAVPELRRIARHVLQAEAVAPDVGVEIVLADAATVQDLNRLYRGRDEPTDVLSFAQSDASDGVGATLAVASDAPSPSDAFIDPPDLTPTLGEIIICVPIAAAQAEAPGHTVAGAIAHLLSHGLLHLLAYDHEDSEAESQRMQTREDAHLAALGYANTYSHGH